MSIGMRHARRPKRLDWRAIRDGVDLARVAMDLLGPAPGRRGDRGRSLWWSCPFHEDRNPSFRVEPGKPWWRCFGCGEKGDAIDLVRRIKGCSFPEAVAYLAGGPAHAGRARPQRSPSRRPVTEPPVGPEGISEAEALALVAESVERLWSAGGRAAMDYLTGPERNLRPETIRAARLGYAPSVRAMTRDGQPYEARGGVIPWPTAGRLTLVKVRQPEGRLPKYAEVYRDRAHHCGIFPGPEAIRPGRPLVIVEGEFDALLLAQELGDLAAVVTLGSASARPGPAILARMLAAAP
jgi:DNA primase